MVAVAIVAAAVVGLLFLRSGDSGPPKAVIVDQLSLTANNPQFAAEARALLQAAGYQVDYFPGYLVTVDFYRELPERGYDLVLVRAHAGRHLRGDGAFTEETALFSAEPYSTTAHVDDQREGRVAKAVYDLADEEAYFSIRPSFVRRSMKGNFDGATVVLMGCDVLRGEQLAKAFRERGAGAVIGWDGPVSADHTDAATLSLLRHHLTQGLSVQDAAAQAMEELGPDPYYGASLLSEPPSG